MAALDITKLFPRHFEISDETEISLYQSEIGDVGCVVWDAALVLCGYISKGRPRSTACSTGGLELEGKTILDLGSGTGAVGLIAAALGAQAVVTDLPVFVPLMEYNIIANKDKLAGSCTAAALTWGDQESIQLLKDSHFPDGVDYILIADCVYYEESVKSLVETIVAFSSPRTTVYCSYEERDTGNKPELQKRFFEMIDEHFSVKEIPQSEQDVEYSSPDIHLMKFTLKNTL